MSLGKFEEEKKTFRFKCRENFEGRKRRLSKMVELGTMKRKLFQVGGTHCLMC